MRKTLLTLFFIAMYSVLFSQTYTPYKIEFYNVGETYPIYSTSSDVTIKIEKTVISINNSLRSVFDIKRKEKNDYIVVERDGGRIVIISVMKDAIDIHYGTYILKFLYYKPNL